MNQMQCGWEPDVSWNTSQSVSNSSFEENPAKWQGRRIILNSSSSVNWQKLDKQPENLFRFVCSSGPQGYCPTASYEFDDEQIELVEKLLTSVSPWSTLANKPIKTIKTFRGVFSPNYDRVVLSRKELSVDSAEIPRWKPHMFINRRRLESEDG